jgi:hypothetical protein
LYTLTIGVTHVLFTQLIFPSPASCRPSPLPLYDRHPLIEHCAL